MRPLPLALLALLAVGACAKRSTSAVDPTLPEKPVEVADAKPQSILEQAAGHLDPTPRATALHWLILQDETPAGGEWGARALYDPSAWVQRAGVEALGERLDEPESLALLEEYVELGQADPYARATAGLRLATVGSERAAKVLAEAWRAETEPWIVAPLALASGAHGDSEAIGAVAEALATGEIGLELEFMKEVGASGHPELQAALKRGAEWVEDELELPYAVAMVQLGDPSGEQQLRKALQHPSPEVRLGVLDMLVELDHPTATALLQRARNDEASVIRSYARLALAARTRSDPDVFLKAWEDEDWEVRQLAVRLVARAAAHPVAGSSKKIAKTAERIVLEAFSDAENPVRLEAIRSAAALEMRGAAPTVAGMTQDPWLHLRIEAAGTALHLGYDPS